MLSVAVPVPEPVRAPDLGQPAPGGGAILPGANGSHPLVGAGQTAKERNAYRARGRADREISLLGRRTWRKTVVQQQAGSAASHFGECGVPVAESVLAPPGPIPNPVVTQRSAGEY
jgi:hypothetical protein